MMKEFELIYRQACEGLIPVSEFLSRLKLLPEFSDDLLAALLEEREKEDWSCLFKLIFAVQAFPSRKFTPVLIELLDEHKDQGYSESLADAFFDIQDERSVTAMVRAIDHYEPGDDDRNFNKKLIYALANIGTEQAIDGIRVAAQNADEQIRSAAEQELLRLGFSSTQLKI